MFGPKDDNRAAVIRESLIGPVFSAFDLATGQLLDNDDDASKLACRLFKNGAFSVRHDYDLSKYKKAI